MEDVQTKCRYKPIFEFVSLKANGKRLEFYCINSKWFLYEARVNTALFIEVSLLSASSCNLF